MKHGLATAPPRFLSPAQFGERLEARGDRAHELGGRTLVDVLTGQRWWVLDELGAEQAGHVVTAAACYRLVGIAAPSPRLVDLDGARLAAMPAVAAWDGRASDESVVELVEQSPADRWVANSLLPLGLRYREIAIPPFPVTLRFDLAGCFGWRTVGVRDPEWSPVLVVDDLDARTVPTLRALRDVSLDELSRAVEIAGLDPTSAATLLGALISRRALLVARLRALTGE